MATHTPTTGTIARERTVVLEPQFRAGFDLTAFAIAICGITCWIAPAALYIGGLI